MYTVKPYFSAPMRYRKLKADRLFDGKRFLKGYVLVIDEKGTVADLQPEEELTDDIETYSGTLTPGFVNCHCHLELSHLKGAIPPGTGLVQFLLSVVKLRGQAESEKWSAIGAAEKELWQNGTAAVADICNTTDALNTKGESDVYWHNLIEVINLRDESLEGNLGKCQGVLQQHIHKGFEAVLTPHAPYSISAGTFQKINEETAGKIISIHNQESTAENELFLNGSGDFLKLYAAMGIEGSPFGVTGKSSLQTWLPHFTNGQTILLVHNTFISEEDILFAKQHAEKNGLHLIYCLCPNANLYIENALPPVELLTKHNCHIVLGTDSYSSNWQLSIAAEIKTLKEKRDVSLETLLQWATSNGAAALGLQQYGSFAKGSKPGVVLLNETDFTTQRIV